MRKALICFLKYPTPGRVKTRLGVDLGDPQAAELYAALAERIITEVYPLEGAYDLKLCVDPAVSLEQYQAWLGQDFCYWEQEGDTLGDRMSFAIQQALDEGYARAAIIGSDCIGMDETFLAGVFDYLDRHDFVLGPSSDGGYYLIAAKNDDPWLFHNMPWSTDSVYEFTVDRIEARDLTYHALAEKIDIDTLEDLVAFREGLPEEHFLAKKVDQLVLQRLKSTSAELHDIDDLR